MARKHKIVTIDAEGRDKGKSFLIVEKSAWDSEKWATRALLTLSKAGVEVPDDVMQAGAIGLLAIGLDAFRQLSFEEAEPLLAEMVTCIHFVPDAATKDPMTGRPMTRGLIMPTEVNDGDIEEVPTLLKLRAEALELHVGFSISAAISTLMAMTARNSSRPRTQTSLDPAEPSSEPVEPA